MDPMRSLSRWIFLGDHRSFLPRSCEGHRVDLVSEIRYNIFVAKKNEYPPVENSRFPRGLVVEVNHRTTFITRDSNCGQSYVIKAPCTTNLCTISDEEDSVLFFPWGQKFTSHI